MGNVNKFVMESGVPLPPKPGGTHRNRLADSIPWGEMKVGDSFIYRYKSSGGLRKRAKAAGISIEIRAVEYETGRDPSIQIACAFRVWRTA